MALYFKVEEDFSSDFASKYATLSPLRKRIINKVIERARLYKELVPSQTTLAKWCYCSRSAISEAFKIFRGFGWIYLESRGWMRSKRIQIGLGIRQMDPNIFRYFHRITATYRATHTIHTKRDITGRKPAGEIQIPDWIQKKEISLDDKLKLSMVSDFAFNEATHKCKDHMANGWRPRNLNKYFVGTAVQIAQKRGEKLDWRAFYNTRQKMMRI